MKKKDVLKVMPAAEAARSVNRHQSQFTIMGPIVPERFRYRLYEALVKKETEINDAMERIRKDYDKWKKT